MLKLANGRALKAPFLNLLRARFPNPLCGPFLVHHPHNEPALHLGPPKYATHVRRLSVTSADELYDYEIDDPDPKHHDFMLADVTHNILRTKISELAGVNYLSEATKEEIDGVADEMFGFVYGERSRLILPCVMSTEKMARWIFFVVDSGSAYTYISEQAIKTFGFDQTMRKWRAHIAGRRIPVCRSSTLSHFKDVNVLGRDYCYLHDLHPWVDEAKGTVKFYFGAKWRVTPTV